MFHKYLLCFALLGGLGAARAQNTIGVLTRIDSLMQPGYNLIYPFNQSTTFLLDNCGRVVHTWEDSVNMRPAATVYMLENGHLIRARRDVFFFGDPIWAGGGGEWVQELDWNGNLIWEWGWNDSTGRLHHDVVPMPNGNVLAIAWEAKTMQEALDAGRDPGFLTEGKVWPDAVIELQPNGSGSADVVWEWHSWDHLVQDYDSTKANYGVVADHPELIDLNFGDPGADWEHFNGLDYNADLDQIILSVPTFNEVWIIDHSTTTAEAASHSGGNSGRGGDLMYRWGNPMAYGRGDSLDTQLGFQHDIHWIDRGGLHPTVTDYGKLMVFNNRAGADYSALGIFAPVFDTLTQSYAMIGNVYGPATYDWTYTAPVPQDFYSPIVSGGQRLPNGNTLILSGDDGHAFEITPSEQIVWEYVTPFVNGLPATQGDTVGQNQNLTFRITRYAPEYPAIASRVLVAGDYIELDPDSAACTLPAVGRTPVAEAGAIRIYPNPATDFVRIEVEKGNVGRVELYDLSGRVLRDAHVRGRAGEVSLAGLGAGFYLVRVDGKAAGKLLVR